MERSKHFKAGNHWFGDGFKWEEGSRIVQEQARGSLLLADRWPHSGYSSPRRYKQCITPLCNLKSAPATSPTQLSPLLSFIPHSCTSQRGWPAGSRAREMVEVSTPEILHLFMMPETSVHPTGLHHPIEIRSLREALSGLQSRRQDLFTGKGSIIFLKKNFKWIKQR